MARIIVVLLAMLLGALITHTVVLFHDTRQERSELYGYALRLGQRGNGLGHEIVHAINLVAANQLTPCSAPDIAFMRNLVFGSIYIRDVGRTSNNRLICSSVIGQIVDPPINGPPDIVVDATKIWTAARLRISTNSRGFVMESRGVSVVANPESFHAMTEASDWSASGFICNRKTGQMVQTAGVPVPLTPKEILAGRFLERDGIVYQPLCRPGGIICTVVSGRQDVFLARTRYVRVVRTLIGMVIGGLIAIILILFDQRRRSMESQLRRAIRKGNLTLVYQPIVDLATEVVIGAETLVRWTDEDGKPIPPDVFVALAESRGFVAGITRHVMHGLVAELGDLLAQGRLRVTFNITSQDLASSTFLRELDLCMDLARIDHASIGLELTERSTAPEGVPARVLRELKDAGYTLYIDDFGTGYSSLAYLHRLAVDAIKIDRAFTHTIGTDAVTASVVPQILEMANRLDLQVVVEGIETAEQAAYFRAAQPGIVGQGWLYSKAIPAAQLRKLLTESSSPASNASAPESVITPTS